MNEDNRENRNCPDEPQEIVSWYRCDDEPQEVVCSYQHDEPLPGHARPQSAPPQKQQKKKKRLGLWIFLGCLAAIAVAVGIGLAVSGGSDAPGGDLPEDGSASSIIDIFQDKQTSIPRIAGDPSVRMNCVDAQGGELTAQEVFAKVNPAVVTVIAMEDESKGTASVGTGVIMTADGYIVTNAHVISGGKSCRVALSSGVTLEAKLVGYDEEEDLAVLYAETQTDLPTAEFGNSDLCSVGDTVYAIGNPLGVELRGTFTDGIISAINRQVEVEGKAMTLLQTNAALNNGNSGGPLINQYGQVIGINVMKMGMDRWSTASVEGLGFAIPIASSAYIVNDILRCGEVQGEPVLGISVDRTPAYLPDGQQAARVYTVDLNGPGDKAGLEVDDLIYEADGVRVETSNDLLRVRHRHAAGEEMILKVCRGGEYLTVSVTLEAKK